MADRSVSTWILLALGVGGIVNGLFMLFATEAWFTRIAADTGPLNFHLVRDVGAAYVTSGVASVRAARTPSLRAVLAGMAALFLGLHGLIHVEDVLAGTQPTSHLLEDFPGVYLPALLLAAIAFRSRARRN
jgi:predicted anti-sigma-YlaC factor YlaD